MTDYKEQVKANLEALYLVTKANPVVAEMINWEGFAKRAKEVGLKYVEGVGLVDEAWDKFFGRDK